MKGELVVETGALQHITNDLHRFADAEEIEQESVYLGADWCFSARKKVSVC